MNETGKTNGCASTADVRHWRRATRTGRRNRYNYNPVISFLYFVRIPPGGGEARERVLSRHSARCSLNREDFISSCLCSHFPPFPLFEVARELLPPPAPAIRSRCTVASLSTYLFFILAARALAVIDSFVYLLANAVPASSFCPPLATLYPRAKIERERKLSAALTFAFSSPRRSPRSARTAEQ